MSQDRYTKSTSLVTSDIMVDYIIDQKETTRKVLRATVVDNPKDKDACISCVIFHQRKGKNATWEDVKSINLHTLKAGEGVKLRLGCSETKALYDHLSEAFQIGAQGVQRGRQKFVVASDQDVVIRAGLESKYILKLIEQGLSEDIWRQLVESDPDLATKLSMARIQTNRIESLREFEESITQEKLENYWQAFLSKNDWIFGYGLSYNFTTKEGEQVYVGGKNVNNSGGQVCDFMAASDGEARFTALVEIKRPSTHLLEKEDRNGCYPISKELAMAVSQIQVYCQSWGTCNSVEIYDYEAEHGVLRVQPKGIVVIGNSSELKSRQQKQAFELFRRNLHNPEIITYDELLARAKFITQDQSSTQSQPSEEYDPDIDDLPF